MRALFPLVFWAFLLLVCATKIVDWTTDYWWFQSLNAGDKWLRMMSWRSGAFVLGALLALAVFGQNIRLALLHLRGSDFALLGGEVAPHGPSFSALQGGARASVWAVMLLAGVASANRFELWAALSNHVAIGQKDTITGTDLSFYLFVLPALAWGWNFFGVLLLLSLLGALLLYFYGELIETGPKLLRVASAASRHLVTVTALLILWSGVRQGILAIEAPIVSGGAPSEIFGQAQNRFEVPLRWMLVFLAVPVAFWMVKPNALKLHTRVQLAGGWAIFTLFIVPLSIPASRGFGFFAPEKEVNNIERHLRTTRENWKLDFASRPLRFGDAKWQPIPATQIPAFDAWPPEALRQAFEKSEAPSNRTVARAHFLNGQAEDQAPIYRAVAQERGNVNSRSGVVLESETARNGALVITRRVPLDSLLLSEQMPDVPRPDSFFAVPNSGAFQRRFNPSYRQATSEEGAVSRATIGRAFLLGWRFWTRELLEMGAPISWRLDPIERASALYPFFDWSHSISTPILVPNPRGQRLVWHMEGFARSRYFPDSASIGGADAWRGVNYLRPAIVVLLDAQTGTVLESRFNASEPFARVYASAFEPSARLVKHGSGDFGAPQNSDFALERARIFARYKRESNDAVAFGQPRLVWRVWNDFTATWPWPRDEKGAAIFAYALAQGNAQKGEMPTIQSLLSVAPDGTARQFTPERPFALPLIASRPEEPKTNGAPKPPPPARFGFHLGEDQSEVSFFRAIARQENGLWKLTVDAEQLSQKPLTAPSSPSFLPNNTLRMLWQEFKNARRNGNWTLAEQRERDIDAILGAPSKAPAAKTTETSRPMRLP